MNLAVAVEALPEGILGIAGDEDHLDPGIDPAHLADQCRPIHLRHHHVGDQQMDLVGRLADQVERGFAAFRLDHPVALVAQGAGAKHPDRVVVLDQQHGAGAGQILGDGRLDGLGAGSRGGGRLARWRGR